MPEIMSDRVGYPAGMMIYCGTPEPPKPDPSVRQEQTWPMMFLRDLTNLSWADALMEKANSKSEEGELFIAACQLFSERTRSLLAMSRTKEVVSALQEMADCSRRLDLAMTMYLSEEPSPEINMQIRASKNALNAAGFFADSDGDILPYPQKKGTASTQQFVLSKSQHS